MNKEKIVSGIAVVALLVSGFTYFHKPDQVVIDRTVDRVVNKLGAVSSLENVDNPFVGIGGVNTWHKEQNMAATSSVVCAFLNPWGATSTLKSFTAQATANGLGSQALYLSTSTSNTAPTSTSTPELVSAFATGAGQFSLPWNDSNATTTIGNLLGNPNQDGTNPFIVGPTEYVTLVMATGTPGTFSSYLSGTCDAVFQRF